MGGLSVASPRQRFSSKTFGCGLSTAIPNANSVFISVQTGFYFFAKKSKINFANIKTLRIFALPFFERYL
jgi:hypothetical protein